MNNYNREQKLLKRYGMTSKQFDEQLEQQGGGCRICGDKTKRMVVDHNHETGAVRGIICGHCNVALGMVGDDIAVLRRMIGYLNGR